MKVYEVIFTDGSSYILPAAEYDRVGIYIEFYECSGNHREYIARFRAEDIRGIVCRGIMGE